MSEADTSTSHSDGSVENRSVLMPIGKSRRSARGHAHSKTCSDIDAEPSSSHTPPPQALTQAQLLARIAEKERICLDLREELERNHNDLTRLKGQLSLSFADPSSPSSSSHTADALAYARERLLHTREALHRKSHSYDATLPHKKALARSMKGSTRPTRSAEKDATKSGTAETEATAQVPSDYSMPHINEEISSTARRWVDGVFTSVVDAVSAIDSFLDDPEPSAKAVHPRSADNSVEMQPVRRFRRGSDQDGTPPRENAAENGRRGAVLPRDALPRDALPRDALPRDALPRDAQPRDALPRDALPRDVLPRTAQEKASLRRRAPNVSKEANILTEANRDLEPRNAHIPEHTQKGASSLLDKLPAWSSVDTRQGPMSLFSHLENSLMSSLDGPLRSVEEFLSVQPDR